MRALILTNEYPPNVYGGAGVHVEYLTRELARLIEVDVRTFGEQDVSARLVAKVEANAADKERLGKYFLVNSDGDSWLPDAQGRTVRLGNVFGRERETLIEWRAAAMRVSCNADLPPSLRFSETRRSLGGGD